jgi:aminoglycoside phosphotransferase (APT) family kinase protein
LKDGTETIPVREAHRFDEAPLADYLNAELPEAGGGLSITQFGYGQSNPTYVLSLNNAEYVLRKQPPGELIPKAHAIDREFRLQRALAETDVPVAKMILYCDDAAIIGTPFYLMERMHGRVFADSALPGIEPAKRRAMYEAVWDTLARLHTVDPEAVGLDDFGRHGGYLTRQIGIWSRQYVNFKTRDIPEMDRLMEWLPDHIPEDQETALIHGDYRIGNVMFHAERPEVVAVFDWELSTLGHPLSDLAFLCLLYRTTTNEYGGIQGHDWRALGIPDEAELNRRYCAATGRSDSVQPFHIAYSLFRYGAIFEGIKSRAAAGIAAAENAEQVGDLAISMARRGWALVESQASR